MVSEGSLLPTVAGNLGTERRRRGSEGRGEQGARTTEAGECPDDSLEESRGFGDVTWMEAGEVFGSHGEEYCGENINRLS